MFSINGVSIFDLVGRFFPRLFEFIGGSAGGQWSIIIIALAVASTIAGGFIKGVLKWVLTAAGVIVFAGVVIYLWTTLALPTEFHI